jgi:hypothetical protein
MKPRQFTNSNFIRELNIHLTTFPFVLYEIIEAYALDKYILMFGERTDKWNFPDPGKPLYIKYFFKGFINRVAVCEFIANDKSTEFPIARYGKKWNISALSDCLNQGLNSNDSFFQLLWLKTETEFREFFIYLNP